MTEQIKQTQTPSKAPKHETAQSETATKKWLVEKTAHRLGVLEEEVKLVLEEVIKTIKTELIEGNEVVIRGFGRFYVAKTNPRPSPFLGGALTEERLKVVFKPSKNLNSNLNENY